MGDGIEDFHVVPMHISFGDREYLDGVDLTLEGLYEKLEEYLTAQHVCNVCACITYPNPPSIAFHEKHGYKTVAHFHASGYKQDAWHDMIWMEKTLCPHTIPPRPFIPFPEL